MRHLAAFACFLGLSTTFAIPGASSTLHAQPPVASPTATPKRAAPIESDAVAFRIPKARTKENLVILGALAGGAALMGGIGLAFHLDSRSKSDEVSALSENTGNVWTQERQDTYDSAVLSRNLSIGFYAAGGALLVATAVAYVITDPGDELVTLSDNGTVSPTIAPTRSGAIVGARWSFR